MYSVMRRTDDDVKVVQAGIATLEEARNIASRMQQRTSNKSAKYYIKGHPRRVAEKRPVSANSGSSTSRNLSINSGISQQGHRKGGKYRVIRVQDNWEQYVKGSFSTEEEACEYALHLQRQAADPATTYQVEYTPSSASSASHANTYRPYKPDVSRHSVISNSHEGGKFSVIRERYGEKSIVKGGLQTENEAYEYGLKLLRKTSDRNIRYFVEYTGSKRHVTSILIRERPSAQQSQPRRKKSTGNRKRRYHQRSHDRETESRTRDTYFPDYSGELLGLGIPAQTGHGRRSRKWFNDL